MKFDRKKIKDNKISFTPENWTDLYQLSNLVEKDDLVYALTSRRVRKGDKTGREGDKGERIKVFIGIKVNSVEFQDSIVERRLRIRGNIIHRSEEAVPLNASHTFNIKEFMTLTVQKLEWKEIHKKLIQDASNKVNKDSIGLLAIEKGLFSVGILNNYKIQFLTKERWNSKGKISNQKVQKKSDNEFFKRVLQTIKDFFKVSSIEFIAIGGPGKYKTKFKDFLENEWPNHNKKIVYEDLSSGSYSGLQEFLSQKSVQKMATQFQIIEEERIINDFNQLLMTNMGRICYGLSQSTEAAEQGAIDSLLINNNYVTEKNSDTKPTIDRLLDLLVKTKVKMLIVDKTSNNGKIVMKFGGMIGTLRYELFPN